MGYSGAVRRGSMHAMVDETQSAAGRQPPSVPGAPPPTRVSPRHCPSCGAALAVDPATDPALPGPDRDRRRRDRPRQGRRRVARATGSCRGSAASTPTRPRAPADAGALAPAGPRRPARDAPARARGRGREPPGRGRRAARRGDRRGPRPGRLAEDAAAAEAVVEQIERGVRGARARSTRSWASPSSTPASRPTDGTPPRRGAATTPAPEPVGATDEAAPPGLTDAGRILAAVPDRLPPPGPSFLREHEVRIGDRRAARRDGPPVRRPRRLVAGAAVGRRRRRRRELPRRRPGRRAAARSAARPARAGHGRGAVRAHPRGRRPAPAPGRPGSSRPTTRPARGARRWRSGPRSGSSRRAPRRCDPNELAETVLAGFRRAVEGLHGRDVASRRAASGRSARLHGPMRDLFDDFLEELRRREAIARGEDPDAGRPPAPGGPNDGGRRPGPDDDDRDDATTTTRRRASRARRAVRATMPRRPARRRPSAGGSAGGSSASSSSPCSCCSASASTCGPTRCGTRASGSTRCSGPGSAPRSACSSARADRRRSSILLLQPLARRPAHATARREPARRVVPRPVRAAQRGRPAGRPGPRPGAGGWDARRPATAGHVRRRTTSPTSRPIAGIVLVGVAVLVALTIGGVGRRVVGDGPAVGEPRAVLARCGDAPSTDPVFGRDIGFFLFELPFLRLVQVAVQRDRPRGAARWSSARYLVGGVARQPRVHDAGPGPPRRSSAGCSCCRSRSATSSTSTSSRTARAASRPASATRTRTPSSSPTTC